jgi:hypothetical protein
MSLLNPILAVLGLAAIAIPIAIHLLSRRKIQHVTWAAMRFLRLSVEQHQRRMRLQDILLLIVRCVMLALLGFALARPTLGCAAARRMLGNSDVAAVLILDNSYSMSCTDGVRSSFDQAKLAADQVIAAMPSGSRVAVMLASNGTPDAVIPEPTLDLNKVRSVIDKAHLTSRGSDLFLALEKAMQTLSGRPEMRKEIYLFTDGQLVAWKQMDRLEQLLRDQKTQVSTSIILVPSDQDQNIAVTQLRLASGLAAVNRELRFEALIKNFGSKPVENLRVTLRIDGEQPTDEQTVASLASGGSIAVPLHAKLRDAGYHIITAAVPTDHLPADDSSTIVVRAINQVKVLLVNGQSGSHAADDEVYYLRSALLSLVPRIGVGQPFLSVNTISPADLESAHFDGYDAVVLAGVADFSQAVANSLADYVHHGGGLIVFPGESTVADFYNQTLADRLHLLPATLGPLHGDASWKDRTDRYFTLQSTGLTHPIAAIWADPQSAGRLDTALFFKAYELTPLPPVSSAGAGPAQNILDFGRSVGDNALTGKPAVIEHTFGLGRVVMFASTASTRWNLLPVKFSVYLPLIDRVIASIVQRQDEGLNIPVGSPFVFHPEDEAVAKDALFFKPGQSDQASESREVELPASGVPTITYTQTDLAGPYTMRLASGSEVKFAVQINSDDNESSLDALGPAQQAELAKFATLMRWTPGQSLQAGIETARSGAELSWHLAWIVLGLAAVEMMLGWWFSRTK